MPSRTVVLARKMRNYGLWGSSERVMSKDKRFRLGPPPGTGQKDWASEVLYFDDTMVAYWIVGGGDEDLTYNSVNCPLSEEELFQRMEELLFDWLEAPKDHLEKPGNADEYIGRLLRPLVLVGLPHIEKTQWEIDIFLVNVGKNTIQVTFKATGQHFCFIENYAGAVVETDGSPAYNPVILAGILTSLKDVTRDWWKANESIAKEPTMATCDKDGVWTVNYAWVAWCMLKGHLGNTPVAAVTHAIMLLEKKYDGAEFDKVICEKGPNPLQFKLYQITKTLVKPEEEGE